MAMRHLVPFRSRPSQVPARREAQQRDPFTALQQQMNELFQQFHSSFGLAPWSEDLAGTWAPMVNVSENENEVKISAELPGLDEKNIDVSISRNALILRGEKSEEEEEKGRNMYRMERKYGSFHREIPLPADVIADKAEASFKKGVLMVRLPKSKEAQKESKKIKINKA